MICVSFARHIVILLILSRFGSNNDSFHHLPIWTAELVTNKPKCFCLSFFLSNITQRQAEVGVSNKNQLVK